jgi:hypothetical protein
MHRESTLRYGGCQASCNIIQLLVLELLSLSLSLSLSHSLSPLSLSLSLHPTQHTQPAARGHGRTAAAVVDRQDGNGYICGNLSLFRPSPLSKCCKNGKRLAHRPCAPAACSPALHTTLLREPFREAGLCRERTDTTQKRERIPVNVLPLTCTQTDKKGSGRNVERERERESRKS